MINNHCVFCSFYLSPLAQQICLICGACEQRRNFQQNRNKKETSVLESEKNCLGSEDRCNSRTQREKRACRI